MTIRPPTPAAHAGNSNAVFSRRRLLIVGAATVLVGCSGNDSPAREAAVDRGQRTNTSATGTSTTRDIRGTTVPPSTSGEPPAACMLTPELTAGPYYLGGHLARGDITEGRPGTPLEFQVRVLALPSCEPLTGAAVDIWHCDAGGEYSGFNGNSLGATQAGGTNDKRFLRGVQLTDTNGVATFTTIYPGWYEGRAVHIHLTVLDGGTLTATYSGGHVAHVGQAFFDEAITTEMLRADAYQSHTGARTTNDQDSIFAQAGPGAVTTITRKNTGGDRGYSGKFTCIVDPAATPPAAPLF